MNNTDLDILEDFDPFFLIGYALKRIYKNLKTKHLPELKEDIQKYWSVITKALPSR